MTVVPPLARLKHLMTDRSLHDAVGFAAQRTHTFATFNFFAIPAPDGPETHADIGDQR